MYSERSSGSVENPGSILLLCLTLSICESPRIHRVSGYIKKEMGGSRKWAGAIRTDVKLVTHTWNDGAPADPCYDS